MAKPANSIRIKKSSIQGKKPEVLDLGELALNFRDKKLFFRSTNGTDYDIDAFSVNNAVTGESNDEVMVNASTKDKKTVIASEDITIANERAVVIASKGVKTVNDYTICGGYTENGQAHTSNRKWEIDNRSGTLKLGGNFATGASFSDYAEMFPNATGEELPLGTLVKIVEGGIAPATDGSLPIGVVSATAGVVLGDSEFEWSGRYMKGDFGEYLLDEDGKKIPNPEYNEDLKQLPRSQRPKEWTTVGLLGQVYVRLTQFVKAGDYVQPTWTEGKGGKAGRKTNIQCIKITSNYNKKKGYAVGLCLIK